MQIFQEYKKLGYSQYTYFNKLILGFILQILQRFIMATVSTKIDGLYRWVQLTNQINLDLNFIQRYLETAKKSPQLLEISDDEDMKEDKNKPVKQEGEKKPVKQEGENKPVKEEEMTKKKQGVLKT